MNLLASSHIARQDGLLRRIYCHLLEPVLTGDLLLRQITFHYNAANRAIVRHQQKRTTYVG